MARTTINTQVIPDGTIVSADLSYPLTDFSSTGIDDNAASTAITIDSSQDVTFTSDAFFPDSGKAIFGAGSDLQLYHDGTNSFATTNTGQFFLSSAASNIWMRGLEGGILNTDGTEYLIRATSNDSVKLFYDNVKKFETTSTGINVTGVTVTDGVTSSAEIDVNLASEGKYFEGGSGNTRRLSITSGTNISAHALHTFDIASINGKYEFKVNSATEFSLDSSNATFSGDVDIEGGLLTVGQGNNGENRIEIGKDRTTNGFAYIDLVGDATYTDFGLRIIRGSTGANAASTIEHRGTGDFNIKTTEVAGLNLQTSGTTRLNIAGNGISTFSSRVDITPNESLRLKGIRGQFSGEYIHLYNKVGIGHPSGWGQGNTETPIYGLSTYGAINIGYGNNATSTFYGQVIPDTNGTRDFGSSSNRWNIGYFSSLRITNVVTNKILKFDGADIDDSLLSDDGTTVSSGANFIPTTDSTYDLGTTTNYWRNIYADNIISDGGDAEFQKVYKDTVTINDSTYTTIATVNGNNLASAVRLNVSGVSSSTVINVDATILVNHYRDILIKSTCGYYTRLYIKVVSDNNEDFAIELKKDTGGNSTQNVDIEITPLNSEEITITNSHGHTALSHEHLTEYGESQSSNDADGGNDYHYWLKDDGAKLKLGASQDLQLYHDGSNSYIKDTGTGSLIIEGDTSTQIKGGTYVFLRSLTNENMLVGNANGSVDLYYDNSKKFETYTSGTSTTGNHAISSGSKLMLRGTSDNNHYVRYSSSGFSGVTIDGPQVVGHQGGELATNIGSDNYSLRWNSGGDVFVRTDLTVYGGFFLDGITGGHFENYQFGVQLDISELTSGGWARSYKINTSDSTGSLNMGVLGNNTTTTYGYFSIGGSDTTGYNSTNSIKLTKGGKVGIKIAGGSSPDTTLHINGNATDGWIKLSTTSGNPYITSTNNLEFYVGNSNSILYLENGTTTVGINKSSGLNAGGFGSPKLVIKQDANNVWGGINIEASGNDAIFGIGTSNDEHIIAGSYRSSAGYKPIKMMVSGQQGFKLNTNQTIEIPKVLSVRGGTMNATDLATYNNSSVTSASLGTYNNQYAFLDLASSNASGGWIDFSYANGGDYLARIRYANSGDYFQWYLGGAEKHRWKSNGNIGINELDPLTKLHITDDVSTAINLYSTYNYSLNRNWRLQLNGFGSGNWGGISLRQSTTNGGTPSVDVFGIDRAGNVGIGINASNTAVNYKLDVRGSIGGNSNIYALSTYAVVLDSNSGSGPQITFGSTGDYDQFGRIAQHSSKFQFITQSRNFEWLNGSTSLMTLQTGGNLGVGGSPVNHKLDVFGTIEAGDTSATQGALTLVQRYSAASNDYIGSISTQYSSGGMILGYGVRGKSGSGSESFTSTFDNFSGIRGAIRIQGGEFNVYSSINAYNTAVGSDVGMTKTFMVGSDGRTYINSTPGNWTETFIDKGLRIYGSRAGLILYSSGTLATHVMQAGTDATKAIHLNHNSSGDLSFYQYSASGETFRLHRNGRLGVNNNNPQRRFHVVDTSAQIRTSFSSPTDSRYAELAWYGVEGFATDSQNNGFVVGMKGGLSTQGLILKTGTNSAYYERIKIFRNGQIVMGGPSGVGTGEGSGQVTLNTDLTYGFVINQNKVNSTLDFCDTLFVKNTNQNNANSCKIGMSTNGTDGQHHRVTLAAERDTSANYRGEFSVHIRQSDSSHPKRLKLDYNGNLTVSGDVIAYGSPSDKRLKQNIKPIHNALDTVQKLQGVTFDWKESKSLLDIKNDIGFIAQDVKEVLPELVRENEDGQMSLRDKGIVPVLVEAIKELKAEIEELKKQIK